MSSKAQSSAHNIPLIIGAGLLVLCFALHLILSPEPLFPQYTKIGAGFWLLAVSFWILGMIHLKRYGSPEGKNYMQTQKLVCKGIFSVIRHPQYFGFLLFSIGFIFISQSIYVLVPTVIAMIFVILGCRREDQIMQEKFGDEWTSYCRKVPALNIVIGIWRKNTSSS